MKQLLMFSGVVILFCGCLVMEETQPQSANAADHASAAPQVDERPLSDLSGIYRTGERTKSGRYLELDGATGRLDLRSQVLDEVPDGTRVWVRGIIRTELHDNRGEGPHQQPKHWNIFMVVHECKTITKPFEQPSSE